ncbi:MAG: hypothetical protein ACOCRK_06335 [bacterium]
MGATDFYQVYEGKNAEEAFNKAVKDAQYYHGTSGYTGTIAEKYSFIEISLPEGKDPREYAEDLVYNEDPRINDKWGPAGCIEIKEPDIKPIKHVKVENITKSGRKKWKTVYKVTDLNGKVADKKDTKTEAIKKARKLAKKNGIEYRVIIDKILTSHNKLEAKVKPKEPDNQLGTYLFFGWAST